VLAAQFTGRCPVMEFAEYNFSGGETRSGSFILPNGTEEILLLTPEEAGWKRSLLAFYRSERGNLRHIRPKTEALRPLPAYDYGQRPHLGRLFYERFPWLPFHHPRIDFDPPEAVYTALTAITRRPDGDINRR
jgi:hypothetical protein